MDVKNEKLSVEAARLIYGVVVDAVSFKLDEGATKKLRANRPKERYEAVINEETLDIELKAYSEQTEKTQ